MIAQVLNLVGLFRRFGVGIHFSSFTRETPVKAARRQDSWALAVVLS
jgi:hypothetical protein